MSVTGLAIIYIIIWWIVFFAILPIDVNRLKTVKIEGEDPGSPENPKMLKKFLYCTGITTVIFIIIYLLIKFEYFLQAILSASIRLCSCCLLPSLKVLVISSIASSNPYTNSSVSSTGIPLKVKTGLL